MSVNQVFDKSTGRLSYGVMGGVMSLEPGFSVEVIVSLTEGGVNQAMDEWGDKLMGRCVFFLGGAHILGWGWGLRAVQ